MSNDSSYKRVRIECPICGHISNFGMFEAIEIDNHDEYTAKGKPSLCTHASSGSLFMFRCNSCGFREPMTYSVSCVDLISQTLLSVAETDKEVREAIDTFDELAQTAPAFKCRMVDTTEELAEKLRIFDDGLDDRAVELCRAVIESKLTQDMMNYNEKLYYEDLDIQCTYDMYDEVEDELIFYVTGSELATEGAIDYSVYAALLDTLPKRTDSVYKFNREWAAAEIERSQKERRRLR